MDSRIRIAITRSPARVVRIVVVVVVIIHRLDRIPRLDDDRIDRFDEHDRATTATNTHAHDDGTIRISSPIASHVVFPKSPSRGGPSRASCVTGHDRPMEGLHTHAGF